MSSLPKYNHLDGKIINNINRAEIRKLPIESSNKIDADAIIKITNNFFDKFASYFPKPVFKLPSIIYGLRISGLIILILFVISCIIIILKINDIRKLYNYSILRIIYYKDNKIIDKKILKINKKVNKKETNYFYDENNILIREEISDLAPFNYKITFTILIIILILIFGVLFQFLSNMHYNRQLRFANPIQRTLIDYLLRFFYPLKWGTIPGNLVKSNFKNASNNNPII